MSIPITGKAAGLVTFACGALKHTVQITLFLGVTLLIINLIVFWIGEDTLQSVLLSGSIFQPGDHCLDRSDSRMRHVSFADRAFPQRQHQLRRCPLPGLSTGAGFGYLILLKNCPDRKEGLKIILWTYLCSVAAGMMLQLLVP